MKILIVTDAWYPQVNGVVTTLSQLGTELTLKGHDVVYLTPEQFKTFELPSYPEIKMAWNVWKVPKLIKEIKPDAIHIATPEGALGLSARMYCSFKNIPFTSSYHTKMPEYMKMKFHIPVWLTYKFMRWCHKDSSAVLVTTPSMLRELQDWDFKCRLVVWTRGADDKIFKPSHRCESFIKQPLLLYAGRVSIEKNLEAFFDLNIPNTIKVVVGDGPQMQQYKEKYTDVIFMGYKHGKDLASVMANADVFVFPSKTDTFGIVMIEAAYCGTPVAAYPVTGPIDFVTEGKNGALDNDLSEAIKKALQIDRNACAEYTSVKFSWNKCASIFLETLVPIKKLDLL